jgi:hypothetical protein
VSFASEPERDDGSLPPVNIVIPDDARELDRDVLAYHREMRALRRRQRRTRLLRPFNGPGGGPAALVPLIALCLALALVGGALLSVLTISPAEQDTTTSPSASPRASSGPSQLTSLPQGNVQLDGETKDVRSLVSSAIALVPNNCRCGPALRRLTSQAVAAGAHVDFIGVGAPSAQLAAETQQFGGDYAIPGDDADGVLANAYHPTSLTVLLVFIDGTAEVQKNLAGKFELGLTPGELNFPGARAGSEPSAQANPTAGHSAG